MKGNVMVGRGAIAAVAALLVLGSQSAGAQEAPIELESTPRWLPEPLRLGPVEGVPEAGLAPAAAEAPVTINNKVTVGLTFEASRLNTDSRFIPPDTMGADGPNHVVEMINGNFEIFSKATGASVSTRSLDSFWINVAGVAIPEAGNFTVDPRIVFDPASGRWFAASIDISDRDGNGINEIANNIYLARSDTDDPTGTWDGLRFAADSTGNAEFHDYPTLAVDADGLYICTQDFQIGGNGTNESCYSIPKADLLLATPSIANITRFEGTPAGLPTVNGSIQAALNFGLSKGRTALLGSTGTALARSNIFGGAGPGATLPAAPVGIIGDPGHTTPPAARQPQDTDTTDTETIENIAPRFVGNVVVIGNSLWAVHAVQGSTTTNSALRWYEINETTNTVIQSALINDPTRDFHEPSIAVNARGDVVIGYTCSGPNLSPSVCVSVGQTSGGVTTFEAPAILFTGNGYYHRDFGSGSPRTPSRNRWGDYSATVIDPVDPCTFWTFQEYVAVGATGDVGPSPDAEGGLWGTRVAQLTFNSCVPAADLQVFKDCKPDQPLLAGQTGTCTIFVENLSGTNPALGVIAIDRHFSNGSFSFGAVTTTKGACTVTANPQIQQGQVSCALDTLAPGETATITVQVTANEPQDINDEVTVTSTSPDFDLSNNRASDGVTVIAVADLSLIKTAPATAVAGTEFHYNLAVSNAGPSAARNVVIEDVLPAGLTIASVSAPGGTCNAGVPGNAALPTRCTFDTVDPGTSKPMQIFVNVLPGFLGILGNNAKVFGDAFDPDNSNNLATIVTAVEGQADLQVQKTDHPDPVIAGSVLTYEVAITNLGPSTASAVKLSDTLPAEVVFKDYTVSGGSGTCTPLAGVVSCDLADLVPGQQVRVVIEVQVSPSVPNGTLITNIATVSSATADPVPGNNTATIQTTVLATADLAITKDGRPELTNPAYRIRYTLTVTNNGASDAQNVQVVDALPLDPKRVIFLYDTGAGDCAYSAATHRVTCNLGTLAAGQSRAIDIVVDVKGSTSIVINIASVSSTTTDPNAANNTARKDVRVKGGPGPGRK
ncbi:MAG: DUF11 domain-containing protein [Deltaproteobacteria bacterium]|nr:DUF11 domain-containing protein [Deltaproteobacteria bacterium]